MLARARAVCESRVVQWTEPCGPGHAARENCLLRCISPDCYETLYTRDPWGPLEEGEIDTSRATRFRECAHHDLRTSERLHEFD